MTKISLYPTINLPLRGTDLGDISEDTGGGAYVSKRILISDLVTGISTFAGGYNNAVSGLTATTIQGALDELDGSVDTNTSAIAVNLATTILNAGNITTLQGLTFYNNNGTLTGLRSVSQAGFDLNFDGRMTFGAGMYPLDTAIMIRQGYDNGIAVQGDFATAALNLTNTVDGALVIAAARGNVSLNGGDIPTVSENRTYIGGFGDASFRLSVSGSLGDQKINGIFSNVGGANGNNVTAGFFKAVGDAVNIAMQLDAQGGTTNTALITGSGRNWLNSSNVPDNTTAIGTNAPNTLHKLLVKGDTSDGSTNIIELTNFSSQSKFRVKTDGNISINGGNSNRTVNINSFAGGGLLVIGSATGPLISAIGGTPDAAFYASNSGTGYAFRSFIGFNYFQQNTGIGGTPSAATTLNVKGTSASTNVAVFTTGLTGTIAENQLIIPNDPTKPINMPNLPIVSTGLIAGDLWNDAGTVKIV